MKLFRAEADKSEDALNEEMKTPMKPPDVR